MSRTVIEQYVEETRRDREQAGRAAMILGPLFWLVVIAGIIGATSCASTPRAGARRVVGARLDWCYGTVYSVADAHACEDAARAECISMGAEPTCGNSYRSTLR